MDDTLNQLERLRDFLHGGHLATTDENASGLLHRACHKVDEIIKSMMERKIKDLNELR